MQVVNVAIPVTKNGQNYPGFTLYPGVDIELVQADCMPPGFFRFVFHNADPDTLPTSILLQGVTSADISENADPHYLAIHTYA
jgi:hypothetical protein